MSVADSLPPIPDVLRPTSVRTALVALPFALAFGVGMVLSTPSAISGLAGILPIGLASWWYLSRRPDPSDTAGIGFILFTIPLVLFPVATFLRSFLSEGGEYGLFTYMLGSMIFGAISIVLAIVCLILAYLLLRDE